MSILKGLLENEDLLIGLGLLSGGSQGQGIGQAGLNSVLQAAQIKKAFAPKKRNIVKSADGRQRYEDTGELVFPNVQVDKSGFRMLSDEEVANRKLNPNKSYQLDEKRNKVSAIGGGDTIINNNDPSATPLKIRKQYLAESKNFNARKSSRDQILANTSKKFKDRTAADDFTLVYQYYKFVDPTSVVREAEFENLQNLGSVGEKIKTIIPKWTRGTTLSKDKVKDLESAMNDSFPSFVKEQKERENTYTNILKDGGFDTNVYMQSFLPNDTKSVVRQSEVLTNNNLTGPRGMGKAKDYSKMTNEELIEEYKRLKGIK
tara:strand:+ start:586 stop:1536 length:951 start_codon:yes stop_codon:yes gene_type:complete